MEEKWMAAAHIADYYAHNPCPEAADPELSILFGISMEDAAGLIFYHNQQAPWETPSSWRRGP